MRLMLPFVFLLFGVSCRLNEKKVQISGRAQGTTYQITYYSKDSINYSKQIDSLLNALDNSLSTYVADSKISRINRNEGRVEVDQFFRDVFTKSVEISKRTSGMFDITVAPIVNAYGFGFTKKSDITEDKIDSLLKFVGYKMVRLEGNQVVKEKPEITLDFNAIAQGYSVDVLGKFLEGQGITNYLVELGGEVRARGRKNNEDYWRVGIDNPEESFGGERKFQGVLRLENQTMATSGNYTRYYEENGKKYAHIIDPFTGYPAKHNLLSATVVANDCMTADAYATAFMVMGVEKSKAFLAKNPDLALEVFLIYDDNGTWKNYISEGLSAKLESL